MRSLLYIKQKDILISGAGDKDLRLWNMLTYKCENIICGVDCSGSNSIYQIDENKIIVGGYRALLIINIEKFMIEEVIHNERFGDVYCLVELRDGSILSGCSNGKVFIYGINTNTIEFKDKSHVGDISSLITLNDHIFVSGAYDEIIKVWEY